MKSFKQFIAMALTLFMILGSAAAITASAKIFDDTAGHDYEEQISILSDLGIIKGTTPDEFSPNAPVTREQMAMMLYRLMMAMDNAGIANTTSFTDLYDPTYNGAVSWAAANKYILGWENTFMPKRGITFQDAMTMIVRALGQASAQMEAGYPWTYITTGIRLGLDENLKNVVFDQELTRAQVACLIYNALTAEYLIAKNVSGTTVYESTTIIEQIYGYSIEETILVATNDYALEGSSIVVKNEYVALKYGDETIYVEFAQLGLEGKDNEWLGRNVKIIFKTNKNTGLVTIAGATIPGEGKEFSKVTVNKDKTLKIDGINYSVVEDYSSALSTNNNELLVYVYGSNGTLTQLKTGAAVEAKLGFYTITMLYDKADENIAARAILKCYNFDQYKTDADGKINIAANLKTSELTGGLLNPKNAKTGDYVLYYYNATNKSLEILQPLTLIKGGFATKLVPTTSATIDGVSYSLGRAGASISAQSIYDAITVGMYFDVVVYDGAIIKVMDDTTQVNANESKYLLTTSLATPMIVDGHLRYYLTANIDGQNRSVITSTAGAEINKVYRYTTEADGSYKLIAMEVTSDVIQSGVNKFVQNGAVIKDIAAYVAESAANTEIAKNGNLYYTLANGSAAAINSISDSFANIDFVTDENSVIIIKNGDSINYSKGVYSSTITVNTGAEIVAVFGNTSGSIKTLKYLYISDGEFGTATEAAAFAKVYAITGAELINNKIYTIYRVYNFKSGAMENVHSLHNDLTVGESYLYDVSGNLSESAKTLGEGLVNEVIGRIVIINGTAYQLTAGARVITITGTGFTITNVEPGTLLMKNVEFVAGGNEISAIIVGSAAAFTGEITDDTITIETTSDLTGIPQSLFETVSVKKGGTAIELGTLTITFTPGSSEITIVTGENFEAGNYEVKFNLAGKAYTVTATVEAET